MAAMTIPDTGHGSTISGLGITTSLKSISALTVGAEPIDITTLGNTTGYKTMRPGDLRNTPDVTVEFYWLGAAPPITTTMIPTVEPYAGTTFTITYSTGTTGGGGTFAGKAFVKSVNFPQAAIGEAMMGSMVIQFDGSDTPTFSPSA